MRKNKKEGKIPNSGRKKMIEGDFVKINVEIRTEYHAKLKPLFKKGVFDEALRMYFEKKGNASPPTPLSERRGGGK